MGMIYDVEAKRGREARNFASAGPTFSVQGAVLNGFGEVMR